MTLHFGDFDDFSVFYMKENDRYVIIINYFDNEKLSVKRKIETKSLK